MPDSLSLSSPINPYSHVLDTLKFLDVSFSSVNPKDIKTSEDCDLAKIVMIINLINHINRHSNIFTMWPRRYVGLTYYNFVDSSKHLFCKGYKNNE